MKPLNANGLGPRINFLIRRVSWFQGSINTHLIYIGTKDSVLIREGPDFRVSSFRGLLYTATSYLMYVCMDVDIRTIVGHVDECYMSYRNGSFLFRVVSFLSIVPAQVLGWMGGRKLESKWNHNNWFYLHSYIKVVNNTLYSDYLYTTNLAIVCDQLTGKGFIIIISSNTLKERSCE